MGIYIKNITKDDLSENGALMWGKQIIFIPPEDIISVPDHGDLIDRDDAENAALLIWCHSSNGDDAMEQTIEHIRHNIVAVVPAERSKDGET